MKAIVYDAPRKFTYREVDVPSIDPDEILLRVRLAAALIRARISTMRALPRE